jgi:lon-related putative ATP-dependent protease
LATPIELKPEALRSACLPNQFNFSSTGELEPLEDVIGQQRAVQAINFGLNMTSPGYNIFVTGIEGTGKTTIVQDIIGEHARSLSTPCDWCLVNNFQDEYRPVAIAVPSGKATVFSKQIQRLIDDVRQRLPKAFEDKLFEEKKNNLQQNFEEQERAIFRGLETAAEKRQLTVQKTTAGIQSIPLHNGEPMSRKAFDQLPAAEREKIETNMQAMQADVESALRDVSKLHQNLAAEMEQLVGQVAHFVVVDRLAVIKEAYKTSADIQRYLDVLQKDIVENVALFMPSDAPPENELANLMPGDRPSLRRYLVNVLVDRRDVSGAPVVFEPNPTHQNVFGWIEKRARLGTVTTDFSMVQAGSLLQANGGFLIMEIESILMDPMVWETLKRALLNKQLYIEEPAAAGGRSTSFLRPMPIALDVKVVLIGGYGAFEMLQNFDPKFNKIFKVRADFDYEVNRSPETIDRYARFIARVCREGNLRHFTADGVASIIEFAGKFVAHQNKLSLRFGPIVGIIKEADYWAGVQGAALVDARHVYRAFDEHRFRYNLYEEKIHAAYLEEAILIDVQGAAVGQVNALAVFQMGDIAFGRPSRITVETFVGRHGVVNIEREARLSGNTHDKGVLILSGYLGRTFAQRHPLCLSVSVTFEQNYGGVDGDSASSTELYAILSSLSGIPIEQGIAVTGSVNQKGRIQSIGGVNQKIEGFFDVCRSRGLTGRQGVIIPQANVQNLMLKKDVIDAVAAGQFHIYPVTEITEGIEILTGVEAGQPDEQGSYPEGTLYHKIQVRLKRDWDRMLQWQKAMADLPSLEAPVSESRREPWPLSKLP